MLHDRVIQSLNRRECCVADVRCQRDLLRIDLNRKTTALFERLDLDLRGTRRNFATLQRWQQKAVQHSAHFGALAFNSNAQVECLNAEGILVARAHRSSLNVPAHENGGPRRPPFSSTLD